ncbi:hypothetical protein GCM10010236_71030 [Streptomyces eurythermus]|nr:hypothetical protein GCM10010236_71030 [Streptomyces eurythermus]
MWFSCESFFYLPDRRRAPHAKYRRRAESAHRRMCGCLSAHGTPDLRRRSVLSESLCAEAHENEQAETEPRGRTRFVRAAGSCRPG